MSSMPTSRALHRHRGSRLDRGVRTRHPMRLPNLGADELRAHIIASWEITDWLFSGVPDDADLAYSPDSLRNPLVFYLGHTAAFYLNKLQLAGLLERGVDAHYEEIFAKGVDPATIGDLDLSTVYPKASEVRAYRKEALALILRAVDRCDLSPCTWEAPSWAFQMGLEHDRIHFETSSVLVRQLPLRAVRPPEGWRPASTGLPPANERVRVSGGGVCLGRPEGHLTYGWDNEYGRREVEVAAFLASARLVSNQEFRQFVGAGGYQNRELWSDAAWGWREAQGVEHPRFWFRDGGDWRLRTVFRALPLPLDWPAEVNHYEAEAYCRWIGARLPTEAEQARLSADAPRLSGDAAFHPGHHLHLAACSPRPVHAGKPTPSGIHDPYGNVWQWLSDDWHPLEGFRTHPYYRDFSDGYFDDEHKMLLGGSWASMGTSASQYYRLWFRPFFYQHAGFRPVWDQ